MRRVLGRVAAALVVLAAAAAAFLWLSPAAQDRFVRFVAARRAGVPHAELLGPDALRVVFCGTGSPLPDRDRGQACAAVFANGRLFLVDAGSGAWERLQRFHVPTGKLEGVLLTHFHSDHVTGIPDVALNSWAAGRTAPLRLWGGPGIERVARGFQEALGPDSTYRTAHHGAELMPAAAAPLEAVLVPPPVGEGRVTVLDDGGVRIEAFRVSHPPVEPAYGYRIESGGRAVVFSGDTAPTPSLVAAARGADVLVQEALAAHMIATIADVLEASGDTRRAAILRDVPEYHTTPVDAARMANEAGVPLLVMNHVVPPVSGPLPQRVFLRGVPDVRRDGTVIAEDGMLIELPRGSKEVRTRMLE